MSVWSTVSKDLKLQGFQDEPKKRAPSRSRRENSFDDSTEQ